MSFNELNAVKCAIPSLGMRLQNLTKFPLIPLVRRVGGGGVGVGWGWGNASEQSLYCGQINIHQL